MGNLANGGTVSGTIGTEEAEDITPPEFDVQVINRWPVLVMFGHVKSAEDNLGHGILSQLYVSY
jgi:hypothetical protein